MPAWCHIAIISLATIQGVLFIIYGFQHLEGKGRTQSDSLGHHKCPSPFDGNDDATENDLLLSLELLRPDCPMSPIPVSRRRYVFIMSEPERHGRRYDLALVLAVASLIRTCPEHPVIVFWNIEHVTPAHERLQRIPGVEIRMVPPRVRDARRYHFLKLLIFEMTEFETVAFFDSDMIFLARPDYVFETCHSRLCAVSDSRTQWGASFNAGMLLVRPNKSWALEVEQNWIGKYRKSFEQKALNSFLKADPVSRHFNFFVSVMEDWQFLEALPWNLWPAVLHVKWWDLRRSDMKLLVQNLCQGNFTSCIPMDKATSM